MLELVGDFETTTDPDDVRVWASCLVNIDTLKVELLDNSIEAFFDYIKDKNSKIFFHNLKFDAEFILSYLLTHGFTHSDSKANNTFSTLITDMGVFYSVTIYFEKMKKSYKKCILQDSLKKLPFSVSNIAKTFKLEESKLECDYKLFREKGHKLTDDEREYIVADCMIVAKALHQQVSEGLTKMTIGADALDGFKTSISKKRFERWFPVLPLEVDADIRLAYRGGFTWLNPKYKGAREHGLAYDVNSLYPSVMYQKFMPFGYPVAFNGEYTPNTVYPLFIQTFWCEFKLKKGFIPTVQLKNNRSFISTEYLTDSIDKVTKISIVKLTMTSVDLALFLAHYDVWNMEYINGYMFKQCQGVFNKYIDKWAKIKAESKGGARIFAKLMLNNLYGKFAKNPLSIQKTPYLDDKGIVKYHTEEPEFLDSVYTAVGAFITAYARDKTIRTAQTVYDRFMYADTDSIHLTGFEIPLNITVHPTDLGAWGFEGYFSDSKFLRAKSYMETPFIPISEGIQLRRGLTYNKVLQGYDGFPVVKCAGMPENVKKQVDYDNFTVGSTYTGKLTPKSFPGGIVLRDTEFTIKH